MFGNCEEKIPVISSNTNEWPLQNNEKIFKGMIMASSSSSTTSRNILMDKTQQQQQQNLQQPLNCPRCDSSNTKFCYYNNYSLSQPRHFCKACKRYWTRGGTLRNVPVGGGCRKNKRVRRSVSSSSTSSSFDISSHHNNSSSSSTATTSCATNPNPQNMSHYMNPLFYGLSDVGSAFTAGSPESTQLKFLQNGTGTGTGYGLNGLGLGFSRNLGQPNFSSSIPCSLTPSMSSLLTSGAQNQQKLGTNNQTLGQNYHLQTLASFQDLQVGGNNSGFNESATGMMNNQDHHQGTATRNMNDQMMEGNVGLSSSSSIDPGSVYSNWLDPSNYIGSSLTSLI